MCFRRDVHPQLQDLLECNWDDRWRRPAPPYTHLYHTATDTHIDTRCLERKRRWRRCVYLLCEGALHGSSVGIVAVLVFMSLLQLEGRGAHTSNDGTIHTSTTATVLCPSSSSGGGGSCGGRDLTNMVGISVLVAVCLLRGLQRFSSPPPDPPPELLPGSGGTGGGEDMDQVGTAAPPAGYRHLFVYGTLKRGFHWCSKYLHSRPSSANTEGEGERVPAVYVGEAVSVSAHRLVVGACGVPYLSLGEGEKVTPPSLSASYRARQEKRRRVPPTCPGIWRGVDGVGGLSTRSG